MKAGRERWLAIVDWHDNYGQSWKKIAVVLGISWQRVSKIYHSRTYRLFGDKVKDE